MSEAEQTATEDPSGLAKMNSDQRYYYLHREEKKIKTLARYHSRPDVIAKREAREKKKAEKEAQNEAKRIEKEKIIHEKTLLAQATSQKKLKNEEGGYG